MLLTLALLSTLVGACDSTPEALDMPTVTVAVEGRGVIEVDTLSEAGEQPVRLLLTAIPEDGWYLDAWSGDLSSSTNPDTLQLDADRTVTAAFGLAVEPIYFDDIPFVEIPAGTFQMGTISPGSGGTDEQPVHTVTISQPFYLSMYEVTTDAWEHVMGTVPFPNQNDLSRQPVVMIDWQEVQQFVGALNTSAGAELYRLPTEAEWEYACRAGSETDYFFGDDPAVLGEYAWYASNWSEDRERKPQRVGLKRPNAFGLFDMLGNVWEWVHDGYSAAYYAESPSIDPQGPASGENRGIRGGGDDDPVYLRCPERSSEGLHEAHYYNGFRLVREIGADK